MRFFSLICVGVILLNAAILLRRARRIEEAQPHRRPDHRKIVRALVLYGSVPFLFTAVGEVLGQVTVAEMMGPDGRKNPWTWGEMAIVLLLYLRIAFWLYVQGGTEFLARHNDLLEFGDQPWRVGMYWGLAMLGGIVGMSMILGGR